MAGEERHHHPGGPRERLWAAHGLSHHGQGPARRGVYRSYALSRAQGVCRRRLGLLDKRLPLLERRRLPLPPPRGAADSRHPALEAEHRRRPEQQHVRLLPQRRHAAALLRQRQRHGHVAALPRINAVDDGRRLRAARGRQALLPGAAAAPDRAAERGGAAAGQGARAGPCHGVARADQGPAGHGGGKEDPHDPRGGGGEGARQGRRGGGRAGAAHGRRRDRLYRGDGQRDL
mmetsp:Transcript_15796/g.40076  ORF Transcript_15796/g.40076 Transcript_15796/m.40076 type:complete len:232 (-) Transcript_15796:666-1361(-)